MTRLATSVRVVDPSEVAQARRIVTQAAQALGLSEVARAKAALIATELATNLLKHANGGTILIGSEDAVAGTLTLVAIDKGPGIRNVTAALQDGYSTAGSQGTGLGAIARAATFFDIYGLADRGTAVLCRVEDDSRPRKQASMPPRLTLAGVCLPKTGEDHPGDAWTAATGREISTISVADGLGHGLSAATASAAAVRIFTETSEQPLDRMLQDAHGALRSTRGAAVGIARIHAAHARVDFAGVGNIAGTIVDDDSLRRMVSLNGIVGHEMRKVQTFSYPWSATAVLVLTSDGISNGWTSASYPGLMQHDPALIAAVIYRDHCRGNDDATVVVAKAS